MTLRRLLLVWGKLILHCSWHLFSCPGMSWALFMNAHKLNLCWVTCWVLVMVIVVAVVFAIAIATVAVILIVTVIVTVIAIVNCQFSLSCITS